MRAYQYQNKQNTGGIYRSLYNICPNHGLDAAL